MKWLPTVGVAEREWVILSALALDDTEGAVEALRDPRISWESLLAAAAGHRLAAALMHALSQADVATPRGVLPLLQASNHSNAHRARVYAEEAARVADFMKSRGGVEIAATKGVPLFFSLYEGDGTRAFADLDLMIHPSDARAVDELLGELGFCHGEPGPSGSGIEQLSRHDEVTYLLSPDHLPRRARAINDLVVPVLNVDVAYSLTWAKARWQVPMDGVFANLDRTEAYGYSLPTLSRPYHFLFVVLHAFRESWIARSQRPDLTHVRDIVRFMRSLGAEELAEVRALVTEFGLEEPLVWITGNLDSAFDLDLTSQFGFGPAPNSWLMEASGAGGRRMRWLAPMRSRMREADWRTVEV